MYKLINETNGATALGTVSNFTSLEVFLTCKKNVDVVICEIFDEDTSVIDAIELIYWLEKNNPEILFVIHSSINLKEFIMQCLPDEIYFKEDSVFDCKQALRSFVKKCSTKEPLSSKNMQDESIELTKEEWNMVYGFCLYFNQKDVADRFKFSSSKTSILKRDAMNKLNVINNVEFIKLINIIRCPINSS